MDVVVAAGEPGGLPVAFCRARAGGALRGDGVAAPGVAPVLRLRPAHRARHRACRAHLRGGVAPRAGHGARHFGSRPRLLRLGMPARHGAHHGELVQAAPHAPPQRTGTPLALATRQVPRAGGPAGDGAVRRALDWRARPAPVALPHGHRGRVARNAICRSRWRQRHLQGGPARGPAPPQVVVRAGLPVLAKACLSVRAAGVLGRHLYRVPVHRDCGAQPCETAILVPLCLSTRRNARPALAAPGAAARQRRGTLPGMRQVQPGLPRRRPARRARRMAADGMLRLLELRGRVQVRRRAIQVRGTLEETRCGHD